MKCKHAAHTSMCDFRVGAIGGAATDVFMLKNSLFTNWLSNMDTGRSILVLAWFELDTRGGTGGEGISGGLSKLELFDDELNESSDGIGIRCCCCCCCCCFDVDNVPSTRHSAPIDKLSELYESDVFWNVGVCRSDPVRNGLNVL